MRTALLFPLALAALTAPLRAADAPAPAEDRAAILAMAGTFDVEFNFKETVALIDGYELRDPYFETATEHVAIVVDQPGRIVLQHLLIVGSRHRVIKHWTQEWVYENRELLEFRARDTWVRRTIGADEARGTWTQRVFSTDDSPRYQGYGRWTHTANVSVWESNPTRRPLPRREYTKRDDYQTLLAINRHVITHEGWAHEQANTKLVVDETGRPERALTRETGLNVYRRVSAAEGAPAQAWWAEHGAYWHVVREAWARALAGPAAVKLADDAHGESRGRALAKLVDEMADAGEPADSDAVRDRIRAAINEFVTDGP